MVRTLFWNIYLKKKRGGFYVDIGAHHPKKYSNTHLLHQRGWRGINVDANPQSIAIFNKQRPGDININVGIHEQPGTLTYYEFADPAVNTFSKIKADDWKKNQRWNAFLGEREVPVVPINTLLNQHLPVKTDIDVLNIDVEGLDLNIIKSLDMAVYQPRVIIIEDHLFDFEHPEKSEIYTYLYGKGYRLYVSLSVSLIFTKYPLHTR